MTAKELIQYLSGFDPEETASVLAVNLENRTVHKVDGYQLVTDAGSPVLLFEFGASEPLDDVLAQAEAKE